MNILNINNENVYFYLALEEYLVKNTNKNYFFLWNTNNCIICGKHQNIYEEINLPFIKKNNIKLARRLSGGGTVFQDNGNLNFTFILNKKSGKQINFKKHIEPIYNYLKELNINVKYTKRNDLFINGKKVSGNAEHVYKNRVLHHGTLLFNSNLNILNEAIKTKGNYVSKSIKSVKKNVTNISNFISNKDFNKFKSNLHSYIKNYYRINENFILDINDIKSIRQLVEKKYITHNWIYNYTSKFKYKGKIKTNIGEIKFELNIDKGIIVDCNFYDNNINLLFIGKEYKIDTINTIISNSKLDKLLQVNSKELLYSFF